jgi:nitroreductase
MVRDLMHQRSSVRIFDGREISEDIVHIMLDAARMAPSGGNEQQYIFGIIKDKQIIKSICAVSYGQEWIRNVPLIIALCTKIKADDQGGREIQKQRFPQFVKDMEIMDKQLYICLNMEEHQTKIPGTIMMLQALEYGIHSTWISRFNVFEVKKYLNLPVNIFPSEMIAFGYPGKNIKLLKKKDLEEIVFENRYESRGGT